MGDVNKGVFVQEKMMNMIAYVRNGTGSEISVSEEEITPIRAVLLCQEIAKYKVMVIHKDWQGLVKAPGLPAYVQDLIVAVRANSELHDKFWRYLELFVAMGS